MQKCDLKEIVVPFTGMKKIDYFKASVLWILAGEKKPAIRIAEKNEESTLDKPDILKIIADAVPGRNSYLMDLTIKSNIHEYVMFDSKYSLEEKISKVAAGIAPFVVA